MTCPRCTLQMPEKTTKCPRCGWKAGMSTLSKMIVAIACTYGIYGIYNGASAIRGASSADVSVPTPVIAHPTVAHVSMVAFAGDSLDECVDFSFTMDADAGVSADHADDALALILNKKKASPATRIRQPCNIQFAGREALGACSFVVGKMVAVSHRYRFETVYGSDAAMKECLTHGSQWTALPRDSDVAQRAEAEFHANKAGDLARQIAKLGREQAQ